MLRYIKTNSDNSDFQQLVAELDADLKIRDGEDHAFYATLNKTDTIKHGIVAYDNAALVGCGALRQYTENTMEIKRMYVVPTRRGEGIASAILNHLEQWAADLHYHKCLLETGKNQPEAIALYKKNNYQIIPNFGKYKNIANSVCFEKTVQV